MTWLSELWTSRDTWLVPDGWRQGRGAWGGLVSGQVMTAASHDIPEQWHPRALTISMMAPVPAGEVRCEVTDLRRGKAVWVRQVQLFQGQQLLSHSVVTFGIARVATSLTAFAHQPPPVVMVNDVQQVPLGAGVAPEFTGQLTFRPALGFPYSGSAERFTAGWIGPPDGHEDPLNAPVIAAYADAWWVTALIALGQNDLRDGVPPVATVDFSLTFTAQPPRGATVGAQGLWHVGEIISADEGYVTEIRRLYTPDGTLLCVNTQVVAVGRSE
jgi:acyl-CoA thioesterase